MIKNLFVLLFFCSNFIFSQYEIKIEAGDLLLFPSVFLYPHKVEPVTKGERYSFVSWAW